MHQTWTFPKLNNSLIYLEKFFKYPLNKCFYLLKRLNIKQSRNDRMVKQIARPTIAGTLFWEKDAWESETKNNEDEDHWKTWENFFALEQIAFDLR